MKNKKKSALIYGIVAYLIYAILTGGIDVIQTRLFGRMSGRVVLADDLRSSISITGTGKEWSMPFVAHYFHHGEPYDIRFESLEESTNVYFKVRVTRVVARFDDGEEKLLSKSTWEREFKDVTWGRSVGEWEEIPGASFNRYADVTIEIQGELEKKDGTIIPFTVDQQFEKKPSLSITTFWIALSRM